jgi:hypothetical protein
MEACHNDGGRANNRVSNLRWDTHKNNERDKLAHGTGRRSGGAKLTESIVREVRRRLDSGERVGVIAKSVGVTSSAISLINLRKNWVWVA